MTIGVAIHIDNIIRGFGPKSAERNAYASGVGGPSIDVGVHVRLQGVARVSDAGGDSGRGTGSGGTARGEIGGPTLFGKGGPGATNFSGI